MEQPCYQRQQWQEDLQLRGDNFSAQAKGFGVQLSVTKSALHHQEDRLKVKGIEIKRCTSLTRLSDLSCKLHHIIGSLLR